MTVWNPCKEVPKITYCRPTIAESHGVLPLDHVAGILADDAAGVLADESKSSLLSCFVSWFCVSFVCK